MSPTVSYPARLWATRLQAYAREEWHAVFALKLSIPTQDAAVDGSRAWLIATANHQRFDRATEQAPYHAAHPPSRRNKKRCRAYRNLTT